MMNAKPTMLPGQCPVLLNPATMPNIPNPVQIEIKPITARNGLLRRILSKTDMWKFFGGLIGQSADRLNRFG